MKLLCDEMDRAYSDICDKGKKREKEDAEIEALKGEILLLEQRRVNVAQSVRDETAAAADKKKEYTEKKIKYRKLIEEEEKDFEQHRTRVTTEIDKVRIREMGQLKSEKAKISSEIFIAKNSLSEIRNEYGQLKSMLAKLREGIPS